jgi:exosortase D (VPLPA-CTERM-specific)
MLVKTDKVEQPTVAHGSTIYSIVFASIAVLLALFTFHDALLELVHRWTVQEEYSHGFLIPVIVAWLLWARRDALVESIGQPSWTGVALILLAAAMHIVGKLSALYFLSQIGFIVALIGVVLGLGGYSLFKVTIIPIVFLLFAIPLPYFIDAVLSFQLQLISSQLGTFFIRLLQIPVYLEGNVIDLGVYKLQVVEACSGLRYLYPLMSLGFLAAYLFQAPLWQRAVVFLSTIPITIVMNSFRIGVVGVLVNYWGPQDADGFLHMFEGWIIFVACAGMLAAEIYLLARLTTGQALFDVFYAPKVKPSRPAGQDLQPGIRLPLLSGFVLLCAAALAGSFVSGRTEILPERTAFATFPNSVGEWRGRASSLDPQTEKFLGLSDYIITDFSKPDRRSVNFYVAYYASQRNGLAPHSPAVCIPGNGWQIANLVRTNFTSSSPNISLPINRAIIEKNATKELVYYWFEERGRTIANEWLSKAYLLADAILQNRTDGALVRLITPIYPGEIESDADKRLQSFIRDFVPVLNRYLPAAPQRQATPAPDRPSVNHS